MSKFTYKTPRALLVCLSILVGFSSSVYATSDESSASKATPSITTYQRPIVFGKFRLLKNGYETKLGEGFFGNVAALRLYRDDDQEEFTGRVGENGEFSMKLAPGDYYLMSISFKHRGETIEPQTNFMFTVSDEHEASYIGTITLETTFSSGYNGMKGSFDRIKISNDCPAECDQRLAKLGLADSDITISLPQWETQVAWAN